MLPIKLTLFGSPRLEREGQSLPLGRRKSLALLAYLAVTGQPQQRDHLLAFFWPDYDPPSARNNLRRELSNLKKELGTACLTTDRTQAALNLSAGLWVDVHNFRELVATAGAHEHGGRLLCPDCARDLTAAVKLCPADFMAGFGLPDAPAFDDWLFFERESLRQTLTTVLQALIGHHSSQGEYELAISYARRWPALDPLHEPAHRALMQLYAWSGQQTAALRQYEECARLLQDELGIAPEPETKSLYEAIKAKRLHGPPATREPGGTAKVEAKERSPSHLAPPSTPAFLDEETPTASADSTVFVGREAELAQLSAFLDKALAGQSGVAFVTGEAGQGKTSLLNAFARQAQATHKNLIVARGVCDVYTGVGDPFLPFRDILRMLIGDVESQWRAGAIGRDHALRLWHLLPQTVQALTEHGPDLIDTFVPANALLNRCHDYDADGTGWAAGLRQFIKRKEVSGSQKPEQSRIFEQVMTVLTTLASQQPLLLIIDDLHWADLSSISLLAHLGRRLSSHPILIIGAYRPEDVAQGREDKTHPLQSILSEFKRQQGDIWVDLDQAEMGKVRAFVDALLDTQPNQLTEHFRQSLAKHTMGQPLFTIELLRDIQARGDLQQDEKGYWIEGEALNLDVLPPRVEGVIERRIDRLDSDLHEMLTVASVEGESFTAEVVARVLGLEDRDCIRRFSRELDRQHRLVQGESTQHFGTKRLARYRFRHNLFHQYLYNQMDGMERTYLHESVGNMLETLYEGQTESITVQLARHFEQAALLTKAINYLLEAGNQSIRLSAYEAAITHLSRGLELLESLPETPERDQQELALQLALGNSHIITKGYASSTVRDAYERARTLSEQVGETVRLFPVLWGLWMYYATSEGYQNALELAEQSLSLAERLGDPTLQPLAHRLMGTTLVFLGKPEQAWVHFKQGFDVYNPRYHETYVLLYGEDPGVVCAAFGAEALWQLGYQDQAIQRVKKAIFLAQELAHPPSLVIALNVGSYLYMFRRDWSRALKQSDAIIDYITEHKAAPHYWLIVAQFIHGRILIGLGRGQEGIQLVDQALTVFLESGSTSAKARMLYHSADAYKAVGRIQEGLTLLTEALEIIQLTGERIDEPGLYWLQGSLLQSIGENRAEVEACFQKGVKVARQQKAKSWEMRAAMSLSRLWLNQGKKEEARQLLSEIYGWFTEGFATADLQEAKALLEELS